MSDLIRRDAVMLRVREFIGNPTYNENMLMNDLNALPSIEPEQTLESAIDYLHSVGWLQEHDRILMESVELKQKKGKWQRRKDSDCWECSQCHAVLENEDLGMHNFYFCYHCGANMMNKSGYMDIEEVHYE